MSRTMNGLTLYRISFRETARARRVQVWERWGKTIESAKASAEQALDQEFYGTAVLVSIEEA